MLKVTGSVFILIAGCGFGISNSFRMKKQLEQLISLQEMLYLLEGEIKHFKRPLPEAFMAAAEEKQELYGEVFCLISKRLLECKYISGSHVWRDSFLEYQTQFVCTKEEFEFFLKAGSFLDANERETQEKELAFYERQLGHMIEKRQNELKEKQRIGMYGSVLTGAFLIILLL